MKKKILAALLAAIMALVMVIGGCSGKRKDIREEFSSYADEAIEIGNDYIAGYYTSDEACERLDVLYEKMDSMAYDENYTTSFDEEKLTDGEKNLKSDIFFLYASIDKKETTNSIKEHIKKLEEY